MAKNRGVVAVVTDGMVRDIPGLEGVGLPCFAAGVTPNSPARNGPGTAGLPVIAGRVSVSAGDVVVGDQDGVVVVPRYMVADVAARLDDVRTAEADLDAKVKAGLEIPDFVKNLLESDRVLEVE
jgi:4-hydroxy-4-methyl-2-oxoglutarate aldolase